LPYQYYYRFAEACKNIYYEAVYLKNELDISKEFNNFINLASM
jgi:hypothetical protein